MTETNDQTGLADQATRQQDKRHPAVERFILHWGDMGGQWGVNRSVSQIHALLYLSTKPLTADEIADSLGIARSNVSNSLKELQTWNLIRRVPVKGDRRDHFEAETDVFEIMVRIAAGRKEREVDPALAALRQCASEIKSDPAIDPTAARRLRAMLEFTEQLNGWYMQMLGVPRPKLDAMIRLGSSVIRYLPLGPLGRGK